MIGSASLRRQAQLLRKNPSFKVVNFRGNVQTRLRKLDEEIVDGECVLFLLFFFHFFFLWYMSTSTSSVGCVGVRNPSVFFFFSKTNKK